MRRYAAALTTWVENIPGMAGAHGALAIEVVLQKVVDHGAIAFNAVLGRKEKHDLLELLGRWVVHPDFIGNAS